MSRERPGAQMWRRNGPPLTHHALSCRLRGGADGRDGLLAARVQRRRQSSLLSDQNQPGLRHHIQEVSPNSGDPKVRPPTRCSELYIKLFLSASRMDRPSKITFLDSAGTAAFEYRVPKGQSHMVRRHSHPPTPFVFFLMCTFPWESTKSAPAQLFVVVTLNCGWRPHACLHPDTSFPAKIHTSPHWVTDTRTRRGRRPLNAAPAICAIIFLINVCEQGREGRKRGGGGFFSCYITAQQRDSEHC